VLAREAELRALRAQIDPHFLFNSLNSISALTATDSRAARAMTLELAGFLRRTLDLGARESIPLREELDLAKSYLEVERVRFGARLRVEWDADEAALECPVPSLLLQPLVENAVRHGVSQLVDGGVIAIQARRHEDRLDVSVANPRDPAASPRTGEGLGLVNVQSRLETLFDGDARISATAQGPEFRVDISIPAPERT
jgi:two-component system, LytTR family, sensor histidine kinase AlgZ